MVAPRKYPVELQERAVRLWPSEQPRRSIAQLARELGVHPQALGNWIRQNEANRGERDDRRPASSWRSCAGCPRRTPSWAAPMRF
jgi:transposase